MSICGIYLTLSSSPSVGITEFFPTFKTTDEYYINFDEDLKNQLKSLKLSL
jgi:predicted secreted protein